MASASDDTTGEIGVSLRGFDDSIRHAYRTLFPGDPDKSDELLDWRFRKNPHGQAKFAVAVENGSIVGMIALVPTRLCNAPGVDLAYQAIDTVVHPSCRGRGLFVKMGKLAQDPDALGGDLLWGFPNANAAPGWFDRLDWTSFGAVPLLMRPLRSSFLLSRVHPKLGRIDFPLIRRRESAAEVYDDPIRLSADCDQLWKQIAPQMGVAVDRNGEWMRWRLMDKPGSSYRCVGQKSEVGTLEAFAATRIADKHGSRLFARLSSIPKGRIPARLTEAASNRNQFRRAGSAQGSCHGCGKWRALVPELSRFGHATSTWLAASTNAPPPRPAQRGERGR